MNLALTLFVLTLISSDEAVQLGKTDTDLDCAAAIGYLVRSVEEQGAVPVTKLTQQKDGSFSINLAVPVDGQATDEFVTFSCTPEII
jgi:hypothetical protein